MTHSNTQKNVTSRTKCTSQLQRKKTFKKWPFEDVASARGRQEPDRLQGFNEAEKRLPYHGLASHIVYKKQEY